MPIADFTEVPLSTLLSLEGRVATVTGGGNGIGAAVARRLAEAGAAVHVADLDLPAAEAVAGLLTADGGRATAGELDVRSSEAIAATAQQVVDDHGRLDIWVNNAGIYPSQPLLEMTDEAWDGVLAVNLRGAFIGSREAARHMIASGAPGVILNIASVSGYRGRRGLAHYSSSKHGLRGLTRSLAVELGPMGIRALAIAPTMTATPGTAAAAVTQHATGTRHAVDVYAQLPLGRAGLPDDVARVAVFCVSDLASFMTGTTVAVDAGQMSM